MKIYIYLTFCLSGIFTFLSIKHIFIVIVSSCKQYTEWYQKLGINNKSFSSKIYVYSSLLIFNKDIFENEKFIWEFGGD